MPLVTTRISPSNWFVPDEDGTYFQPFNVTMSAKLGKPTSFTLTVRGPDTLAPSPRTRRCCHGRSRPAWR